jgi:hypothetical protein
MNTLPYRTPADYLARAKRLQREGSPYAHRAMQAAALAYATAYAAEQRNSALVAKGLSGLRQMSLSDAASDDLDSMLRSLGANAQVQQYMSIIRPIVDVANGVIAVIAMQAGGDQKVMAALGWMRFLTGSSSAPPGMSDGDIRSLADFVRATAFLSDPEAVNTILSVAQGAGGFLDSLTGGDAGAQLVPVVTAVVGFFRLFRERLASNTRIQALVAGQPQTTIPREAPNCATLVCPGTQQKRVSPVDGTCECYDVTAAQRAASTPYSIAFQNYRLAVTARKLVEGVLLLPPGRATAGAQAIDCASSCGLLWASTEMRRVNGSIPAIPGTPAPAGPLRYFDARTAPQGCNCTGVRLALPGGPVFTDTDPGDPNTPPPPVSNTGAGVKVAGGVGAAALLWFLFR